MVRFATEKAREDGKKAVRLDVLSTNTPAVRTYAGSGFRYICSKFRDGAKGLKEFMAYEFPVEEEAV